MKISFKNEWPIWLALAAPFVFIAVYWNEFPEQIPVHFNIDGQPDGYQEKTFGLLLTPVINIGVYFLLLVIPRIDPSRKNFLLFIDKYKILRRVIHIFVAGIFFIISLYALGYDINITKMVPYAVVIMFLVFGNYFGNIRQNYFIGIRTPWTLSDETIWTRTHRMAAKLWVASSVIMLVVLLVFPPLLWLFLAYIGAVTLVPVIYSYILFREKMKMRSL